MNATESSSSSRVQHSRRESKGEQTDIRVWDDFVAHVREYVRNDPEVAACLCLGVGFILGWKLKPW